MKVFTFFLLSILSFKSYSKKNILFIAVDDLKPLIGAYGDDFAVTPNIDELASYGTIFTNSHVQQAICAPSRVSLLTGLRPDLTEVWDLETQMRDRNPNIITLPQHYKDNGYKTIGMGKIFDNRSVDNGLDKKSWSIPYIRVNVNHKIHGNSITGFQSPENKEILSDIRDKAAAEGIPNQGMWQYLRSKYKPSTESFDISDDGYFDGAMTLKAIDQINKLSNSDQPFFLAVGFQKPHLPFVAPKKYWDMYDPADIPLPQSFGQITTPRLKQVHELHAAGKHERKGGFAMPVNEEEARALLALTYGMISFIDDAIGEILSQLETSGMLENTVVVLTSDHGDLGGDHGVMLKRMHHYQGLLRVPTLWAEPGAAASVRDDLISTIDFPTTILKRAGLQPFNGAMGRDFFSDPEPDGLIIEEQAGRPQPGSANPPGLRTLVTRTHRMTLSPDNNFSELYDLAEDPNENINLFNAPEAATRRADLMEIMVRRMMQMQSTSPLPPFAP